MRLNHSRRKVKSPAPTNWIVVAHGDDGSVFVAKAGNPNVIGAKATCRSEQSDGFAA
jgi:hypothetical protein